MAELKESLRKCPEQLKTKWFGEDVSFRYMIEGFGVSIPEVPDKRDMMDAITEVCPFEVWPCCHASVIVCGWRVSHTAPANAANDPLLEQADILHKMVCVTPEHPGVSILDKPLRCCVNAMPLSSGVRLPLVR